MREEAKRRDEESKRRDEEMREFNREILLRNEKVYTAMIAQLDVLPTDVVNAADRRPVSQGAVWATPVVVAKKGWQGAQALS